MIGNDVAHNTPSAVQQRCYTVDDLRVILNVSRSTVYQLLKRNEFRWFQIGGGKYRISKRVLMIGWTVKAKIDSLNNVMPPC